MKLENNSAITLSAHAQHRLQSRFKKNKAVVQLVLRFGTQYRAGNNCIAYYIDHKSIKQAEKEGFTQLCPFRNIVVIESEEGNIITLWKGKTIPKHWRVLA